MHNNLAAYLLLGMCRPHVLVKFRVEIVREVKECQILQPEHESRTNIIVNSFKETCNAVQPGYRQKDGLIKYKDVKRSRKTKENMKTKDDLRSHLRRPGMFLSRWSGYTRTLVAREIASRNVFDIWSQLGRFVPLRLTMFFRGYRNPQITGNSF